MQTIALLYSCDFKIRTNVVFYVELFFGNKRVNVALVKSIKRVLKSTTIFGRDVSEEDNAIFFQAVFWTFLTAISEGCIATLEYDIKYLQCFLTFLHNNKPSTGEMSRPETPDKYHHKKTEISTGVLRQYRTIVL